MSEWVRIKDTWLRVDAIVGYSQRPAGFRDVPGSNQKIKSSAETSVILMGTREPLHFHGDHVGEVQVAILKRQEQLRSEVKP